MKRNLGLAILISVMSWPLLAQAPTGTLTGNVKGANGPLVGVLVTATSPALQGIKTTSTSENGDYIFRFLAPGDYRVKFELQSYQTLEQEVKVSVAQTAKIDALMPQTQIAEELTVVATYETVSMTQQVATTIEARLLNKLPVGRDITNYVALSPGVTQNGPRNGITIGGAMSYENLFLINGVVVNENIRGQSIPLFIEDAVEETTTQTSGISAEYGRFSGGVVNTLTKSGGNEFHASIRDTLVNDSWTAQTPKPKNRIDKVNSTYEATFGGFVLKDKLWFFMAGRDNKLNQGQQTYTTATDQNPTPYTYAEKERRYEGKLTFSLSQNHRLVGSYIKRNYDRTNMAFFGVAWDTDSLTNPKMPDELQAYSYSGVLSNKLFVEAQYSKRKRTYFDYGSKFVGNRIKGTPGYDLAEGASFNTSYFCGSCNPETRDNQDILLKSSLFLSSTNLGSHDVVFGYDTFNDIREANNYQSATDFVVAAKSVMLGPRGQVYPVFDPTYNEHAIEWWPIFQLSKGTAFKTNSLFVNDRWRLNNSLSINIGLRYDKNDGRNADGVVTVKDSKFSPRLGLTYDPKADGDVQINVSYGKYVAGIANSQADSSSKGGQPAYFGWQYTGDPLNVDCNPATGQNCLSIRETLTKLWAWFDTNGGTYNSNYFGSPSVPGLNVFIPKSLKSPSTDEFTVGASKRLGAKGVIRVDYINRKYSDFYTVRTDKAAGVTSSRYGNLDNQIYENSNNLLTKKYWAVLTSWSYRPLAKLDLGGNWTWSRAYGNFIGEDAGAGPVPSGLSQYPEYKQQKWNAPVGDLGIDQRHRARIYAVYDLLTAGRNRVSVSMMETYMSGRPYGAEGAIDSTTYVHNVAYYSGPPPTVTYFYTSRDRFHWEAMTSTDLAISYSFNLKMLGADFQVFIEPKMTNIFNEKAVISGNTYIDDSTTDTTLSSFNPFTEKPTEGTNWRKGTNFGKPVDPSSYQQPRTYYISFGLRF